MPLFGGILNTDRLNRALTTLSKSSGRTTNEQRSPSESCGRDIASTLSAVADLVAYSIKDEEEKKQKKKSISCSSASSSSSTLSSSSKENTPTSIQNTIRTSTSTSNSNSNSSGSRSNGKKSLSTPLSQKRRDASSSEKKVSRHLQDRILSSSSSSSSSSPLDASAHRKTTECLDEDEVVARRIAVKCLEEDELDAKLRKANRPNDIEKLLKQEIMSVREDLRSSQADAALNKKALSATKNKLKETLDELMRTREDLIEMKNDRDKMKNDRDEIRLLFQNHRCHQSSCSVLRDEAESANEKVKQALNEIEKLNTRLRLAKNLSVSTKVQLDEALSEIEQLKSEQCDVNADVDVDANRHVNIDVNQCQSNQSQKISFRQHIDTEGSEESTTNKADNVYHTPSKRSVVSSPLRPSSASVKMVAEQKFLSTNCSYTNTRDEEHEETDAFEKHLRQFYKVHNPTKSPHEVKKLLVKYQGRKNDLVQHLEKKYNCSFVRAVV